MHAAKVSRHGHLRARHKRALALVAIVLSACSTVGAPESKRTSTPSTPEASPTPQVHVEHEFGEEQPDKGAPVAPPIAALEQPQPTAAAPAADDLERKQAPGPHAKREDRAAAVSEGMAMGALGDSIASGGPSGVGVGAGAGYAAAKSSMRSGMPLTMEAFGPVPSPRADLANRSGSGNTERYAHQSDNPFEKVEDSPLSTFSIDVDTASYSNVRRFLHDGVKPPADAVRIEELVNYFRYDYPVPDSDAPVAVSSEVSIAPWQTSHRLVRIGLRTRDIPAAEVPASNLVFLIDVSGSMQDPDKLPLLKRGLSLLADQLRPQDRLAMVVYAGASGVVLPSTSGADKRRILDALEQLAAGGSTNGAEGIRLAYRVARDAFVKGGVNRVILATDGDFNVGTTSEGELVRLIEQERKTGVALSVLGFGRGNLNDSGMEALADHGDGNYAYVDSIAEAHKVLVREAGSTLVTVAKDVKLQIEWNPTKVASYRLIGFEDRRLAARDFNDDKKDAGELGAGHTVTALYEVALTESEHPHADVDPLRYQSERAPSAAAAGNELLTVKLRYKRPAEDKSRLFSAVVRDTAAPLAQTSEDFRWAAAVAGFGMILRDSEHRGQASLSMMKDLARSATGADLHGERHELLAMMDQAGALGIGATAEASDPKTPGALRVARGN